jgi:hypothetical protein
MLSTVSEELEGHLPEVIENLSRASLDHARDLMRAAHKVNDEGLPHKIGNCRSLETFDGNQRDNRVTTFDHPVGHAGSPEVPCRQRLKTACNAVPTQHTANPERD